MKAVFLDRDGVICENREDYVKSWDEFEFLPGSFDALKTLAKTDFLIFFITNQSPINRGILAVADVEDINIKMTEQIVKSGGRIDDIFICPHAPDEGCDCRKPQPGLLIRARDKYDVDLSLSYLVGDALSDIQAGKTVGTKTILVRTGRGSKQLEDINNHIKKPDHIAKDLSDAVKWIITDENTRGGRH